MPVEGSRFGDRRRGRRFDGNREVSNGEVGHSRALLAAVELHDPYTAQHSRNTVALAGRVARRMGLTDEERSEVELVAMLHDVGKIGLPESILGKPGPLSGNERHAVHEHPAAGAQVVANVEELHHLAPAIRAAHERWDGQGYPDGLEAEKIPLSSRITFVCDAYDAMTTDRPYRRAMSPAAAIRELERCAGTQFCARCVEALLGVLSAPGFAAPTEPA
jgi:HD-GYP domain-containing protein (c-di-GMP phosphodiesterase class II)